MDEVLTKVEVDFFIPSFGHFTETYDLANPNDIAVWKGNNKLTGSIQLRVREVGYSRVTETVLENLKKAQENSKLILSQLKKGS
ncbi:MAG: hypothetical protein HRT44_12150 [Bdellovibrionales bacterium]|nr:hypothetical protein [Bdellovibrionales bacterium]